MVDTFGTLHAPKLYAHGIDALELASSGSIGFTLGDTGALDLALGSDGGVRVAAVGAGRGLVASTESGAAGLRVEDGGSAALFGAGAGLSVGGGLVSASAPEHTVLVGGLAKLAVDASGVTMAEAYATGKLRVPNVPAPSQPAGEPEDGDIVYNASNLRFEGFSDGAWDQLGGSLQDRDKDTYIRAEESPPGTDDDTLRFNTFGAERMRITKAGLLGYNTAAPKTDVDIVGTARVTGRMLACGTDFSSGSRQVTMSVRGNGSDMVVDGAHNEGTGLRIAGVASPLAYSGRKSKVYEKSLQWSNGREGTASLCQKGGWYGEPHWKMKGGSFHLSHVNPDSGDEVAIIMRIGDRDELQILRHVVNSSGEAYEMLGKIGGRPAGEAAVACSRGHAKLDSLRTTYSAASGSLQAMIESYSASLAYSVKAAFWPAGAECPSAAEIAAAAARGDGITLGGLGAHRDNVNLAVATRMWDGSAISSSAAAAASPRGVLMMCAVVDFVDGGRSEVHRSYAALAFDTPATNGFSKMEFSMSVTASQPALAAPSALVAEIKARILEQHRDVIGVQLSHVPAPGGAGITVTGLCLASGAGVLGRLTPEALLGADDVTPPGAPSVPLAGLAMLSVAVSKPPTAPAIGSLQQVPAPPGKVGVAYQTSGASGLLMAMSATPLPLPDSYMFAAASAPLPVAPGSETGTVELAVDVGDGLYLYVAAVDPNGGRSRVTSIFVDSPLMLHLPHTCYTTPAGERSIAMPENGGASLLGDITALTDSDTCTAVFMLLPEGDAALADDQALIALALDPATAGAVSAELAAARP
jgi:hypothetical protein